MKIVIYGLSLILLFGCCKETIILKSYTNCQLVKSINSKDTSVIIDYLIDNKVLKSIFFNDSKSINSVLNYIYSKDSLIQVFTNNKNSTSSIFLFNIDSSLIIRKNQKDSYVILNNLIVENRKSSSNIVYNYYPDNTIKSLTYSSGAITKYSYFNIEDKISYLDYTLWGLSQYFRLNTKFNLVKSIDYGNSVHDYIYEYDKDSNVTTRYILKNGNYGDTTYYFYKCSN